MAYKALIFDLDGTLIDSVRDMSEALNDALKEVDIPFSYTPDEVAHKLVGGGASNLVHRALGQYDTPEMFDKLKAAYMPKYKEYQNKHTKAFPGVLKTLKTLKKNGVTLFVCTNKPHDIATAIVEKIFGHDMFLEVLGHKVGMPVKPDPGIVNYFSKKYFLDLKNTLYVGDSRIDIETANNAKVNSCLVTWGYETYTWEVKSKSTFVIDDIKDLITIVL